MNYYLVSFADYGGDCTIKYNRLVVSEKPLSYEEIQNKFEFGRIIKIEVLDKIEEEDKNTDKSLIDDLFDYNI